MSYPEVEGGGAGGVILPPRWGVQEDEVVERGVKGGVCEGSVILPPRQGELLNTPPW